MSILSRIAPVPQQFRYLPGEKLLIGCPGKANYKIDSQILPGCTLATIAVERLRTRLERLLNTAEGGEVVIRLSMAEPAEEIKNADQGYAICAEGNTITITGFGEAGVYYAVTTMIQILKVEQGILSLPAFEMVDYPDMKTRGYFMETRYGSNLMELEDWKHLVDHIADRKQNHLTVSVYGCWCVQYDGKVSEYLYVPIKKYPKLQTPVYGKYFSPKKGEWVDFKKLPPMVEKDYLGELIAYGKTKGVEVLPMFNSFGHNTLIPNQYPEVSAKDENGEPTRTGFCTSNPKTYEMLFDIYDEIIDRYLTPNGITSFDIGLDEVGDGIAENEEDIFRTRSPWCRCPECSKLDRGQRFVNHAVKLAKHLKEKGMKTIYMYHDMLIEKQWSNNSFRLGDNCSNLMTALKDNDLFDTVCIDWWTYSAKKEGLMYQTTRPELGMRTTVKPWNGYYHWSIVTHPLENISLVSEIGHRENVEGMRAYSAWDESFDKNHRAQADFAWNYDGTGTIENTRERYAQLNFPTRYQEAKQALDLMEECVTSQHPESMSRYQLLLNTLSYYRYSYVAAGKPYPRQFPGEPVAFLKENRQYVQEIKNIAAIAKEAETIFDKLSLDADCNMFMARRYRYETMNYRTLCEDYLALIEMDRLAGILAQTRSESVKAEIQALAKSRKEARLSLMALLEETKEEFLLASHMRNHSIFMQYFADLESYLAATNVQDVVLNFENNTHFASSVFWYLR